MLSARYLANLSDDLVELYSKLEYDIKKDIFKRLNKLQKVTDATVYQTEIVQQVGGLRSDINELVADYDQKAKEQLKRLYAEAMEKATKSDLRHYPTAKRELSENQTQAVNAAIDRLLEPERINKTYASQSAKYEEIYSSLTRMTATVADATEKEFIKEANNAYMKVSTGGFSWQDAYTTAVKNLATNSVKTVLYTGSGKIVERSIESATRMNILTGINQNASQQTLENAENLGTDLVEVSAHIGARPEHAEWQGQVYCLSGEREYTDGNGHRRIARDFYKTCHLGEATGICGINCRHSFYPYFEGMPLEYNNKELDEMKDKKVDLDGKKVTPYEAEQELRLAERNIRAYKTEIVGYEETNHTDTPQYVKAKTKLAEWQKRARSVTSQSGIRRNYINEYVGTKTGVQPRGADTQTTLKQLQSEGKTRSISKTEHNSYSTMILNQIVQKPNGELGYNTIMIDSRKVSGYALNSEHPLGQHKAKVFKSALGFTADDADELQRQILKKVDENKMVEQENKGYGRRFEQVIEIDGKNGKKANVLTAWIENDDGTKRLTTLFITEKDIT